MSAKIAMKTQEKGAGQNIIPARSLAPQHRAALSQHLNNVAESRNRSPRDVIAELSAGHDFSRIQINSESRAVDPQSCVFTRVTPRFCPFGGACHTCPALVQAKVTHDQPNDRYEQEADQMAAMVMEKPNLARDSDTETRQTTGRRLMITASPQYTGIPDTIKDAIRKSRGQPLDKSTREFMELRFGGINFGHVQIHTDRVAGESARVLNAIAYTVGRDIVFGTEQYSPEKDQWKRLLAHELAHVVQQTGDGSKVQSAPIWIQRTIGDGHDLSSPRFRLDPVLEACYDNERILKKGDSGEAVIKLQHALIDAGYLLPSFGVDGKFGAETKAAVEAFQTSSGLTGSDVDGKVGPVTMNLLDNRFPPTAPPPIPTGNWTQSCVLNILCQWNRSLVSQLRSSTVKKFDDIYWDDPYYGGTNWTTRRFNGGGFADPSTRLIGLRSDANCVGAVDTLYHEVFHQNQPAGLRTLVSETQAYRFTEAWLIARGLPGRPSFRILDPATGATVVSVSAVESFVRARYPGPTAVGGDQVIGRTPAGNSILQRPDGSTYTRAPVAGDSYPGHMTVVNEAIINPMTWVCP